MKKHSRSGASDFSIARKSTDSGWGGDALRSTAVALRHLEGFERLEGSALAGIPLLRIAAARSGAPYGCIGGSQMVLTFFPVGDARWLSETVVIGVCCKRGSGVLS